MPNLRSTPQSAKRFAERRRSGGRPVPRDGRDRSGGGRSLSMPRWTFDVSTLAGARAAPIPRRLEPELATRSNEAPSGDGWLHEIKFDGYRLIARVEGRAVRLFSRNGKDWTARFPALVDALADLDIDEALLDGELVALQADGTSSFRLLQEALASNRT